jgi:hypothetical protein
LHFKNLDKNNKNNFTMKKLMILLLLSYCSLVSAKNTPPPTARDSFLFIVEQIRSEVRTIQQQYDIDMAKLDEAMTANAAILSLKEAKGEYDSGYLQALSLKVHYMEESDKLVAESQFNITKTRYRKGIDLIKMIYEKVLALDHHFAALQTYQNIAQITNPNSYPEFQEARKVLEKKTSKTTNPLKLPAILETNPYISIANTLVGFAVSAIDSKDKNEEVEKISCIMDFTVRMSADLSVINHETGFLRDYNNTLKEESATLFDEYVKVIGYSVPIDRCRKSDDWDKVYEMLDAYVLEMETSLKKAPNDKTVYKKQVNLEFSVDRLLDYINKYSMFVTQGEKYYQKFKGIVGTYENQVKCADKLPRQFSDLQKDIDISIEKFNNSYNIAELKGSKWKDLIYGND